MTKRDFFILVIRIYGLMIAISSIMSLMQFIPWVRSDFEVNALLWFIGTLALLGAVFLLLVGGAGRIVTTLSLDKGFDDQRIEVGNLKPHDLIKIATFIFGGLLIVDNFPVMLTNIYHAFVGELSMQIFEPETKHAWAVNAIKVLLGYLLVTNYDRVAKRLTITEGGRQLMAEKETKVPD